MSAGNVRAIFAEIFASERLAKMSDKFILFLDDQRYMHELIRPALQQIRADYSFVKTIKDACACLDNAGKLDAIICDIELGGSSGLDFVEEVRGARKITNIPIIILSQHTDKATLDKAMAVGADDYIIKPFNKFILKRKLENIFGSFPS